MSDLFRFSPVLEPTPIRTELYRDRTERSRFVTIDYWQSASAWEAFRTAFAKEFEDLDGRCAIVTNREAKLGKFEPLG